MDILTISDAISVLDYLHRRALICDKCGDKLATHEHTGALHHRCTDCVSPNGRYRPYKAPSVLERRICDALVRWNAINPSEAGFRPSGDLADCEGHQ